MNKEEIKEEIIEFLSKEKPGAKVKNIYLWGSRWFGSFHKDSDYDFFIILEGYEQEEVQNVHHYISKDGKHCDLCLYNYDLFVGQLSHEMWAVPIFFVEEKEAILYSKLPFELKTMKLRRSVGLNVRINLELGMNQFQKDQLKCRKRIVYILRYFGFTYQIITFGKIVDWVQDLKFYQYLVKTTFKTWKDFEKEWIEIYKKFNSSLYEILNQFKKYNQIQKDILSTFDFIQERGLRSLYLDLSINTFKVKDNIYFLSITEHESPKNVNIVKECCGLLINSREDKKILKVISSPPKMILGHNHKYIEEIDWNSSEVYLFYDGIICTMYYFENEFKISNLNSYDSHNTMKNGKILSKAFWEIWDDKKYEFPKKDENCCYYFLLIDEPEFVNPNFKDIICVGWKELPNCKEKHIRELKYNWGYIEKVKTPESIQILEKKSKFLHEHRGYLLVDKHFNRSIVESQLIVNLTILLEEEILNKEFILLMIIIQSHDSKYLAENFPVKKEENSYKIIRENFHKLRQKVTESLNEIPDDCKNSKQSFNIYIEKFPRLIRSILNAINNYELKDFDEMFFYTQNGGVVDRRTKMLEKGFMEWVNGKQ